MPAPELDYRFQFAQLWERSGDDGYANPIIGARQQICVRWENRKAEMLSPTGQSIQVDAMVVVICDIPVGSIMWLGDTASLVGSGIPDEGLMIVVAFDNTPDVKGRVQRRVAGLKRYNDVLPTIEVEV